MASPIYSNIIVQLFDQINMVLNSYVFNGYTEVSNYLRKPLSMAFTLYVAIYGLCITQGWVDGSIKNMVKVTLKLGIILMFAMEWATFSQYAVTGIQGGAEEIGVALLNATPINLPDFAGSGIKGALQSIFIEVTEVGHSIWIKGSLSRPGTYLSAFLYWLFGYSSIVLSAIEIIGAYVTLAILFATAPLFISFTIFKPTHSFFDRWLGAIAGYAFTLVFVSAASALVISLTQWVVMDCYQDPSKTSESMTWVPLLFVSVLGIGLIHKVTHVAKSIGGTVSTVSTSNLFAGVVGGAIGGAMAMINPIRKPIYKGAAKVGKKIKDSNMVSSIRDKLRGVSSA